MLIAALVVALACTNAAGALDAQTVVKLGADDANTKNEAVNALVASGDEAALALLLSVQAGEASVTPAGRVVIVRGDQVFDAATMAPIVPPPDQYEGIVINNRLRGTLDAAIGALKLLSPDRGYPPGIRKGDRVHQSGRSAAPDRKGVGQGERSGHQEFAGADQSVA